MGTAKPMTTSHEDSRDREIVFTRVLDAPRDLVFKAWTESMHVAQWWGPHGYTTTIHEMDVRPGGVWRFIMHGPDGRDYHNHIVYKEVVRPERLAYSQTGEGVDFEATVTFAVEGGTKTKLTLRLIFPTATERDRVEKEFGAVEGGKQTLERLSRYVAAMPGLASQPGKRSFVLTRVFDAPRSLVFKAWTDAEHLKHWWGPVGWIIGTCKVDLRPGGIFLYSIRMPNAPDMWGKFVYREILPPERLVFVNCFSDPNGGLTRHPFSPTWPLEILNTVTLAEHEGKTTLTLSAAAINATEEELKTFEQGIQFMEKGFVGTLDQLAQYLAKA
jgi:uncharacterized protein YndB with AHSA1/START domain